MIFDDLLNEHGVTAYQVSKETGVPQSSLSSWRKGKSVPKHENLKKIAAYFDVTVDYLLSVTSYPDIETISAVSQYEAKQERIKKEPSTSGVGSAKQAFFNKLDSLTEEEMEEVLDFAEFLLEKRKEDQE